MNRKHSYPLTVVAAVVLAATGAVDVVDTAADAAPAEVESGGLRMVAAVDSNTVVPAGDTTLGVPFAHAVKVSGNFSVALDAPSALRGGEIVAGYLVGCAVDIANGISVAIAPSVGVNAGVAPSFGVDFGLEGFGLGDFGLGDFGLGDFGQDSYRNGGSDRNGSDHGGSRHGGSEQNGSGVEDFGLDIQAPPSVGVGVGIEPSVGVEGGLAGELAVNLAPGTVTAAVIGAAELDEGATFPYTFAHSNTPLNVNGCLSPASAMPFITVRADSQNGSVQTTGYGDQFVF